MSFAILQCVCGRDGLQTGSYEAGYRDGGGDDRAWMLRERGGRLVRRAKVASHGIVRYKEGRRCR